MIEPLIRPAYLDIADPRQALLTYHRQMAQDLRTTLMDQMAFEAQYDPEFIADSWWEQRVENACWEDGSIVAVWRDRLRFHERCMKVLTNG